MVVHRMGHIGASMVEWGTSRELLTRTDTPSKPVKRRDYRKLMVRPLKEMVLVVGKPFLTSQKDLG